MNEKDEKKKVLGGVGLLVICYAIYFYSQFRFIGTSGSHNPPLYLPLVYSAVLVICSMFFYAFNKKIGEKVFIFAQALFLIIWICALALTFNAPL